jgi:hypothetical protein
MSNPDVETCWTAVSFNVEEIKMGLVVDELWGCQLDLTHLQLCFIKVFGVSNI